jgi:hypothetical protein
MSFKQSILYPPQPNTSRGEYTKLSASNNKISYANGKSVIVSLAPIQSCTMLDLAAATDP